VPENAIEEVASEVAATNLQPFFDASIRGVGELDYSVFEHVGLELKFRSKESAGDKGGTPARKKDEKPKGYLGISTRGSHSIGSVLSGSPAAISGLYSDDEVVSLDNIKCDAGSLISRCEDRSPGDSVRVLVFRRDLLTEVSVKLGTKPLECAYFEQTKHPTLAQQTAYANWLKHGMQAEDEASRGSR
jgi:predicted metalloprotease with PDZ domain